MDLTRLYNLTTPELREEAERLGVSDTYAMSRGQLIHAIRDRVNGPPSSEGLLGKVIGFAKWALQTTAAAALEERENEVAQGGGSPDRSAQTPVPSVGSTASEAEAEAETEAEAEAEAEAVSGASSGAASEIASVSEGARETGRAGVASSGPPSRPPAGVFSRSPGMFEEPFPTRTMARILADQGHFKRSLAIYASLVRDEPGDRELSAEADEVRSRARRSHLH